VHDCRAVVDSSFLRELDCRKFERRCALCDVHTLPVDKRPRELGVAFINREKLSMRTVRGWLDRMVRPIRGCDTKAVSAREDGDKIDKKMPDHVGHQVTSPNIEQ
jgi:hypothetical protein